MKGNTMTTHFVTVETILVVEGDLAKEQIIDAALQQLHERVQKRQLQFQIESEGCTTQKVFDVKGKKVRQVCKQCGSPLRKNGKCSDETCPYSDRQQNDEFTVG